MSPNRCWPLLFTFTALLFVVAPLLAVLPRAELAHAATFTVDSTLDEQRDPTAFAGMCQSTPSARCTLRAAIQTAAQLGGRNTIALPAGLYTLSLDLGSLALPPSTGRNELRIEPAPGADASNVIIDGDRANGGLFDVFVGPSPALTLAGVTIQNAGGAGMNLGEGAQLNVDGAIRIQDVAGAGIDLGPNSVVNIAGLTLLNTGGPGINMVNNSVLDLTGGPTPDALGTIQNTQGPAVNAVGDGNTVSIRNLTISGAVAGSGAGINFVSNGGTLSLFNVTANGNAASGSGGVINAVGNGSNISIASVTLSSNSAATGGGVHLAGTGSAFSISDANFSDNSASMNGGGISNNTGSGSLTTLSRVNLSRNSAPVGGGIHNASGMVQLTGTIVANSLAGNNCAGAPLISLGNNISSDGTCGL